MNNDSNCEAVANTMEVSAVQTAAPLSSQIDVPGEWVAPISERPLMVVNISPPVDWADIEVESKPTPKRKKTRRGCKAGWRVQMARYVKAIGEYADKIWEEIVDGVLAQFADDIVACAEAAVQTVPPVQDSLPILHPLVLFASPAQVQHLMMYPDVRIPVRLPSPEQWEVNYGNRRRSCPAAIFTHVDWSRMFPDGTYNFD